MVVLFWVCMRVYGLYRAYNQAYYSLVRKVAALRETAAVRR